MKFAGVQMLYESELPTEQAATLAKVLQQQNMKVINVEIAAYAANLPQLAGARPRVCTSPSFTRSTRVRTPRPALGGHLRQVGSEGRSQGVLQHRAGIRGLRLDGRAALRSGPEGSRPQPDPGQPDRAAQQHHELLGRQPHRARKPGQEHPAQLLATAQLKNGKIVRVSPSPISGYVCSPGGNHPTNGWKPQTR